MLRHVFEWARERVDPARPWLMLGKGPSFNLRDRYDLSTYDLLSLNHVVREQVVRAAHMIDLDVVLACADVLERQTSVVIMPWYPHIHNRVGARNLAELAATVPVLDRLAQQDRLLWYDLSTSPKRHGPGPVVRATYFSAEAALHLLALAGIRRIRTLGIDGGTRYSGTFDDLRGQTLLANGQPSFDLQFQGFARTILETGVDFVPLDLEAPARVRVMYTPIERLPAHVLQHSIHRRSSLTVDVEMIPVPVPAPDILRKDGTIQLGARVHCLADLRDVWTRGVPVTPVQAPAEGRAAAAARPSAGVPLVVYAGHGSAPWLSRVHPLGYRWIDDLLDGVRRGAIAAALVADEVRRGHVRPSLLPQVELGRTEPLLLPPSVQTLDQGFRSVDGQPVREFRPADAGAMVEALWRAVSRRARASWHGRSGASP